MDFNKVMQKQYATSSQTAEYDAGLRAYMIKVYNYMAAALGLTGIVAMLVASSPETIHLVHGTPFAFVIMFAPLGIVLYLSMRINKLSFSSAQTWFWVFAGVMGLSLSWIFVAYTSESITRVFFITSAMFGSMSLYGYTTKKDLSAMGRFFIMGLFGLIIASLVNLFLQSSALHFAVSVIGVVIFAGLTAYDTQKIKNMYASVAGNTEATGKAAIMGALSLYLDFINLMLMLLRLMGDRR